MHSIYSNAPVLTYKRTGQNEVGVILINEKMNMT